MSLKAKVANKFLTDSDGYAIGVVARVVEIPEHTKKVGKKEVNYAAQFEFLIQVESSQKLITLKVWTGQTLNNEQFKVNGITDYNKFTRLCLQLGLVTEADLLTKLNSLQVDVEAVEGTQIKFKLEKSRTKEGLHVIDIRSIELVQ